MIVRSKANQSHTPDTMKHFFQRLSLRAGQIFCFLVISATSCFAEAIPIQTETGPLVIERGDIPPMYKNEVLDSRYFEFINKVFPLGIPREPITADRHHFLFRYCAALFESRQYSAALSCLDAVKRSIAKYGDTTPLLKTVFGRPTGMNMQGAGSEYPLAVREAQLRSELNLELGDLQQAFHWANVAEQLRISLNLEKYPLLIGAFRNRVLTRTHCEMEVELMGMSMMGYRPCGGKLHSWTDVTSHFAATTWLGGDAERSKTYILELENILNSFDGSFDKVLRARLRSALVRAYMTRKEYALALKLADEESHIVADLFTLSFGLFAMTRGAGSGADIFLMTLNEQHTISTKFQVAHARVEVGRLADAKSFLDEILVKEEIKALPGIYWGALYDRGRIADSEGKPDEAINYYQRAVDEIEWQRSTINTESAKIGFFGDRQAVYQSLIRLLFQSGRLEDAFLMGERSKSRALVDMLASKQDFRVTGTNMEKIRQLLSRSQANEVSLTRDSTPDQEVLVRATRSFAGVQTAGSEQVKAIFGELRNLKLESRAALASQAPELASLISVPQLGLADIRQAMPHDHAIVSYYDDGKSLYAFIIDHQELKAVRLDRSGLEDEISGFRTVIYERKEEHRTQARKLYDRLVAPLSPFLRQSRLIIAGHGKLHYLPFAALFDGNQYLIDRFELTYLPSASTLKYIAGRKFPDKAGALLALGNPDIGHRKYDLPFAEKEAQLVASIFPGSVVLLNAQASKKNLLNYGAGFRYLHFATHGKFDADNPLGSALMLAGNSATDVSDQLTVSELYSMTLDADLVTLSACETGLGKVANGDDVVGLVRGFLYAGANQVVSTLWPIDDEATSILMAHFYRHLKAGKSAARAIREAQLALKTRSTDPIFWAPFQLTAGR